MIALQFVLGAAAAGLPYSPTPDPTWQPKFPPGCHQFSAVGVAHVQHGLPWDPPDTTLVYVTQRGNTSLSPVMAINTTDNSLVTSWGKQDVAIAPGPPASWGAQTRAPYLRSDHH